jgi:hypothetical protein
MPDNHDISTQTSRVDAREDQEATNPSQISASSSSQEEITEPTFNDKCFITFCLFSAQIALVKLMKFQYLGLLGNSYISSCIFRPFA